MTRFAQFWGLPFVRLFLKCFVPPGCPAAVKTENSASQIETKGYSAKRKPLLCSSPLLFLFAHTLPESDRVRALISTILPGERTDRVLRSDHDFLALGPHTRQTKKNPRFHGHRLDDHVLPSGGLCAFAIISDL